MQTDTHIEVISPYHCYGCSRHTVAYRLSPAKTVGPVWLQPDRGARPFCHANFSRISYLHKLRVRRRCAR